MLYNRGDEVIIISEDYYHKHKNESDEIVFDNSTYNFTSRHSKYCGRVAHINWIELDGVGNYYYRLDVDTGLHWTDDMVFLLDKKPIYKPDDKVVMNDGLIGTVDYSYWDDKNDCYSYMISIAWVDFAICKESELMPYIKEGTALNPVESMPNATKIVDGEVKVDGYIDVTKLQSRVLDCCPNIIQLPDGCQFIDQDGNVIKASKITIAKKNIIYPTNYSDACKVMGISCLSNGTAGYKSSLLLKLQKLILCYDAYCKLYAEDIGLDKSWEADWSFNKETDGYYTIYTFNGEIVLGATAHRNAILLFPTAELRDIFYKNFSYLIEDCKTLL